ncbi:MAG: chemotaxis response regulator protein-glutamate methylesterase [Terriglobia bacterium]
MRIAIVNDTPMAVEVLRRFLEGLPDHELAWVAHDGKGAVEQCAKDVPDLILMDLIMPVMDGVEATRQIMAQSPCAILVVTASVNKNSAKVFEAMGAGALDAVRTPIMGSGVKAEGAISLLKKISTIGRLLGRSRSLGRLTKSEPAVSRTVSEQNRLVIIGASAGGPTALATILGGLPKEFPAAIIVVQHVDSQFAPSMVEWLNEHSALPVHIAKTGDSPQSGTVLVAGSKDHLIFADSKTLALTAEPLDCSYQPSIDVFFESALRHWKGELIAVLLTGMGQDGARGLKALRNAGVMTIAQDRFSSVVYGMPKAAAELDAAARILPLDKIGRSLVSSFKVQGI